MFKVEKKENIFEANTFTYLHFKCAYLLISLSCVIVKWMKMDSGQLKHTSFVLYVSMFYFPFGCSSLELKVWFDWMLCNNAAFKYSLKD